MAQIWEFRECFNWFDRDNDEKIQGADLPTAVRAMGQYWTFGEVRQLAIGETFMTSLYILY